MAKTAVALLGLGTMGAGMAANLLKADVELTIYNRTAAKAAPFAARGARIASTPAEAANGASIILSMLADDAASREAWIGNNGALEAAEAGTVLIEASTVSPEWIKELEQRATSRGLDLLDAPVTGSRTQVEAAQLVFLVGGSAAALEKVTPVLQSMSKEIVYLGPSGSGAKLKLINNFLCGVQIASLAEGLTWLEKSGLDVEKALAVLKAGAPGSPVIQGVSARMASRDYTVNFVLKLMAKDLLYAHDAAALLGISLTTAANASVLFDQAISQGYAEEDMAAVIEPLRALINGQK